MDERLRNLERRYLQGTLTTAEQIQLRSWYTSVQGYCPSWFVIRYIRELIDSYVASRRQAYKDVTIEVTKLIETAPVDQAHPSIQEVTRMRLKESAIEYEKSRQGSILNTNITTSEQMIAAGLESDPLIVIDVEMPLVVVANTEVVIQRTSAMGYYQTAIRASLEQCGYYACATPIEDLQHPTQHLIVVGFPQKPHGRFILDREFTRLFLEEFSPHSLLEINLATFVITAELAGQQEPNVDQGIIWLVPGSLQFWLQSEYITSGYLVLVSVPEQIFINHSIHRGVAVRELNRYEDPVIPPQMIYFYDPKDQSIRIVPTEIDYVKTCIYLRLLAEK